MTYILAGERGYICDLASISGYDDLEKFVDKMPNVMALRELIDDGTTRRIETVKRNIREVLPKVTDINVKKVLEVMLKGLNKCSEVAIISQ